MKRSCITLPKSKSRSKKAAVHSCFTRITVLEIFSKFTRAPVIDVELSLRTAFLRIFPGDCINK